MAELVPKEGFRTGSGWVPGMDWVPILSGLILIHGFLMIWCFTILNNRLQIGLIALDTKIAGAIKSVINETMQNIVPTEPPSVLSMILPQLLSKNQGQAPIMDILRSEDGKFA